MFISKGSKGEVIKIVQFTPTSLKDISNLSLGDLKPDNTVDDSANTNNNDIIKVMATVIAIVDHFTSEHPEIKIVFAGNTRTRMIMYFRILKTYYETFSKTHSITVLVKERHGFKEVPFVVSESDRYLAFFVKRKL